MFTKGRTYNDDKLQFGRRTVRPEAESVERQEQQIAPTSAIQKASMASQLLTPPEAMRLQRTMGNQVVSRLLAQPSLEQTSRTPMIQRSLGGEIASANAEGLWAALRRFGVKTVFREKVNYFKRIQDAPEVINSYEEAVIYLFQDDPEPRNIAAVEKARKAIVAKQEKAALEAEQARKAASMAARYPSNVLGMYYRGDGRPQSQVWSNGLAPYGVMPVGQARAKIQYWFGDTGASPVDLHDSWVRNNTDPTPPAGGPNGGILACGNDIGCGGYGAGVNGAVRNVYQIDLAGAGLQVVQPTHAVLGVQPHPQQGPALILNAPTLATATIIGVRGMGNSGHETSFFCGIPPANITLIYERTGVDEMPGGGRGWVIPL